MPDGGSAADGDDDDDRPVAPAAAAKSGSAWPIRRRALLSAAAGAGAGMLLLAGFQRLDIGIPSLDLLGGGGCAGGPELPDCLGRVHPSDADASGCTGVDGSSFSATGKSAANWFGFGDCGTWKTYDVSADEEYELVAYTGGCTSLSDADLAVQESEEGDWATRQRISPGGDAANTHRTSYSPESDQMRIRREGEEDGGVYLSVVRRPRWDDALASSVDSTTVQGSETNADLPEGAVLQDGADPGDVTWQYEGVAAQGVTWNGVDVGTDRITYRIGIAGHVLTRREEQPAGAGGFLLEPPSDGPAAGSDPPVSVPTHAVVQNGYAVATGKNARIETDGVGDAFAVDASEWRYGATGDVVEERTAALADAVGPAFDPDHTSAEAAGVAAVSEAGWLSGDLFTDATAEVFEETSGYMAALGDLRTDVSTGCEDLLNWVENRVTANRVARAANLCSGVGAAGHFAHVEVSVPADESAEITVTSQFLAGPPFEDGSATIERTLVLNPDAERTERLTPASQGRVETVELGQDGDSYTVRPLQDGQTVEEMYKYSTDGHPHSHSGYGLSNQSTLFLWRGPEGVSLVMIHDERFDDQKGGTVTFEFEGLPEDGEWAVRDDPSHNADSFSTEEMTTQWSPNHTDGGAYRGIGCGNAEEITITPDFQEGIEGWRVLSANESGSLGRIYSLDPETPVTIDLSGG